MGSGANTVPLQESCPSLREPTCPACSYLTQKQKVRARLGVFYRAPLNAIFMICTEWVDIETMVESTDLVVFVGTPPLSAWPSLEEP